MKPTRTGWFHVRRTEGERKRMTDSKVYGEFKGPYRQKSVKKRIERLFLDNLGKVLGREVILRAARDPKTKKEPENWHQRLSELRTDDGYTILSWRNRGDLKVQEYLMPHATKRKKAGKRVRPDDETWVAILERAKHCCEWSEGGQVCGLHEGDVDPVGGGRVKLTPDHKNPHSLNQMPTHPIRVSGRRYAAAIRSRKRTTGIRRLGR